VHVQGRIENLHPGVKAWVELCQRLQLLSPMVRRHNLKELILLQELTKLENR